MVQPGEMSEYPPGRVLAGARDWRTEGDGQKGSMVSPTSSPGESELYAALLEVTKDRSDGIAMGREVCVAAGISADEADSMFRELEDRGLVLCSPSSGPVTLVCLIRIDERAARA